MKTIASVHRFGDRVAVYVGDGSTTYLSAKQARALARALRSCAKSVVDEAFANSCFGTASVKTITHDQEIAEIRGFPRNRKVPE